MRDKTIHKRGSGVLCHITCLPSEFGIGDLGPGAYEFVDFLAQAQQAYWQILPLNPTDPNQGNSPYNSISAFAGNTLLISPELLLNQGLLEEKDTKPRPQFREDFCDYPRVISYKEKIFAQAFDNYKSSQKNKDKYTRFCLNNAFWLENFVLFKVISKHFNSYTWSNWDEGLKERRAERLGGIKKDLAEELEKEKFLQYLFSEQWSSLKKYCNQRKIKLMGDIPLYVSYDSVDVWGNPDIFKLDEEKRPSFLSGVPPDYFSKTGQLWGSPVYNWDVLKKDNFAWWVERLRYNLGLFDTVRIDHFRGLIAYWQVPSGKQSALNGKWVKVPYENLFEVLENNFSFNSIVAEDLGLISEEVKAVMQRYNFTGMKVLLFAFDNDDPNHPYLPHNYDKNCIVYTGTHDNNTVIGWFKQEADPQKKKRLFSYLNKEVTAKEINWEFIKLAMSSAADISIFPLQDLFGLDQEARMNIPSKGKGNWQWRFKSRQLSPSLSKRLSKMTFKFSRV